MIGIVDYGAGNLRSVKLALDHLGLPATLVSIPSDVEGVDRLILPGVGHFQSALVNLHRSGLYAVISEWLAASRPLLGICLGMQLLFSGSEEAEKECRGFAYFSGCLQRFQGRKTLHMGWNWVTPRERSPLFAGMEQGGYFYFVHRYYAPAEGQDGLSASSDFTLKLAAAVERGPIKGVQFHPEKSGKSGLRLLANWGASC